MGGLLVTLAGVGTFAAYASTTAAPTHRYVVAASTIIEGQRLTTEDLRVIALDLPDDLASQAFSDPGLLTGASALSPIEPNQLIAPAALRLAAPAYRTSADLIPADDARDARNREFSFSIERDKALNGRVQRGETLDLVATYGSGLDAYSTVVIRSTRVLDVDNAAKGTVGSTGKITLTIAVGSDDELLAATHALEIGKVTLVRATGAAPDLSAGSKEAARYQPPVDPKSRADSSEGGARRPKATASAVAPTTNGPNSPATTPTPPVGPDTP